MPPDLLTLTNLRVKRAGKLRIDDQINLAGTLDVSFAGELTVGKRIIASVMSVTDGGVITQLFTTATAFFKVDLSTNTLAIDAFSRIDVTGRGFLGEGQPGNPVAGGMTVGFQAGSTGGSGGSYGGFGGGGSANPLYGDAGDPNDVGSGAGKVFNGPLGGNGGGLIRIVAQTLQLDGSIVADGGQGTEDGGGGSGGGVRIDVGRLIGTGRISANGGNSGPGRFFVGWRGGGGGGRVAVYYQNATEFDLTRITVSGGNGATNGQDGTVFTKQQVAIRDLLPGEVPVMLALSGATGAGRGEPVQLASLAMPVVEFGIERRRIIIDFEKVRKDMEASFSLYPQYLNRYLELAEEQAGKETDLDPIYTYDLNGNRTSMIDPTGITNYTYDALNRVTSITNNRGFVTSFSYDALGRRTSMAHANGVQTTYQYDAASQLTRLAHQLGAATINSFDYTYDKVGNRKTKTDRNGAASYTYDTRNRLVEAINPLPTNPLESFTYDAVGNRTTSNQNGASTFNVANQLLEDSAFTYSYDANGNLTRKTNKTTGEITSYEYTAENQLVRVVKNGTVVNYKYDGLGRRVEKEINDGVTTKVTRFIFDNEDILLELDGQNNITARYTHGPGIDEPLVMEKGGASLFYHADGLGSITEITDSTGLVKQRYAYSSFGKIESQLDPSFVQPYTFTAREFDPETDLYHYRERQYDWRTGRFRQQDPLRDILFIPDSLNPYLYVANNPVNFRDPFGLARCGCTPKTFGERFAKNLTETNRAFGFPVSSIRNLVTAGATARALNTVTLGRFIFSGLQRLPTGVAPAFGASPFFSTAETAILAGSTTLINAALNFAAFEIGAATGSLINAAFLQDECGESLLFR